MKIVTELADACESVNSLNAFVKESIQELNDFFNFDYHTLKAYNTDIEKLILFKNNTLRHIDFSQLYNRALLLHLLHYCERYNLNSPAEQLIPIIEENKINPGHRFRATTFFISNIDSNSTLIDRFELICKNIEIAINHEEDSPNEAISSFLTYYSTIIRDTYPHIKYPTEVNEKIKRHQLLSEFSFLKHPAIVQAAAIDFVNPETAFEKIQSIIDDLLQKRSLSVALSTNSIDSYLIEDGTQYKQLLNYTEKSFEKIREISVERMKDFEEKNEIHRSLGRGVTIISNEAQMYSYLVSFGNSHYAKIISALEQLPFNKITNKVEIFDWSCGQGLATMVLLEFLNTKKINIDITQTTLIEPSNLCLKRAALHVTHLKENVKLKSINKDLDSIDKAEITSNPGTTKIHLFSNILDVEDFSLRNLLTNIDNSQKGVNYFICVSPFINDIKASRLDSFQDFFKNKYPSTFNSWKDLTNGNQPTDKYWNCNTNFNGKMGVFCKHSTNGCHKKWTRIIKVFEVTL